MPSPPPTGTSSSGASIETVVLVGAGDIASCNNTGAQATARLLDMVDGTVFTAGDNAYENGTPAEFANCYQPTWGRHKARTRPSPGNHDYYTTGAAGYFDYFGEAAGPGRRGYYSFDYGAWKILSLNSNVPAGPGSDQASWVENELKASRARCTLAYWHHPAFSSGYEGDMPHMKHVWQLLYDNRVEIVVAGHSHNYERLAPQDASGQRNSDRGIREFVVGTGGNGFTPLDSIRSTSEAINDRSLGVLKLSLAPSSYTWEFLPVNGGSFHDSGSGTCF